MKSNKEFICKGCKWSENSTDKWAYCTKEGHTCNGEQFAPVHQCDEFEEWFWRGGYE